MRPDRSKSACAWLFASKGLFFFEKKNQKTFLIFDLR